MNKRTALSGWRDRAGGGGDGEHLASVPRGREPRAYDLLVRSSVKSTRSERAARRKVGLP